MATHPCLRVQTYHYHIQNSDAHDPISHRFSMHVPKPLDLGAMRQAAQLLVGTHDFTQLSNNGEDQRKRDPVKTLTRVDLVQLDQALGRGALRLEVRTAGGQLQETAGTTAGHMQREAMQFNLCTAQ